mmetsp:Transcript_83377/g.258947  ORF Transcript_83377/g.258947 Transcript_83377/m.258947 type:complete len:274 (-) Transcript_83377:15-836(-)
MATHSPSDMIYISLPMSPCLMTVSPASKHFSVSPNSTVEPSDPNALAASADNPEPESLMTSRSDSDSMDASACCAASPPPLVAAPPLPAAIQEKLSNWSISVEAVGPTKYRETSLAEGSPAAEPASSPVSPPLSADAGPGAVVTSRSRRCVSERSCLVSCRPTVFGTPSNLFRTSAPSRAPISVALEITETSVIGLLSPSSSSALGGSFMTSESCAKASVLEAWVRIGVPGKQYRSLSTPRAESLGSPKPSTMTRGCATTPAAVSTESLEPSP